MAVSTTTTSTAVTVEVSLLLDSGEQRNLFPCAKRQCRCIGSTCTYFLAPVIGTGVRVYVPTTSTGAPTVGVRSLTFRNVLGAVNVQPQWTPHCRSTWNAGVGAWEFAIRTLTRSGPCMFQVVVQCEDGMWSRSSPFHISTSLPNWMYLEGIVPRSLLEAEFAKLGVRNFNQYHACTSTFVRVEDSKQALQYRFLPELLPGVVRELITLSLPSKRPRHAFREFEAAVRDCALTRQPMDNMRAFLLPGVALRSVLPAVAAATALPPAASSPLKRKREDQPAAAWPAADDLDGQEDDAAVWPGETTTTPCAAPDFDEPPFPMYMVAASKYVLPKHEVDRMLSLLTLPKDIRHAFDTPHCDAARLECAESLLDVELCGDMVWDDISALLELCP